MPHEVIGQEGAGTNTFTASKWIAGGNCPLVGPVINFAAVNDQVSWPDAAYLRPGPLPMSLAVWANPAADGTNVYCLISKDTAANGNGWLLQANVTYLGAVSSGSVAFTAQTSASPANFFQVGTAAGATLVNGNWHLFGVSFDGVNAPTVYYDGRTIVQSNTVTGTYGGMNNTDTLVLGNAQGGGQGGVGTGGKAFSIAFAAFWIHQGGASPLSAAQHWQLFQETYAFFRTPMPPLFKNAVGAAATFNAAWMRQQPVIGSGVY